MLNPLSYLPKLFKHLLNPISYLLNLLSYLPNQFKHLPNPLQQPPEFIVVQLELLSNQLQKLQKSSSRQFSGSFLGLYIN